jgi:hypothetical protein
MPLGVLDNGDVLAFYRRLSLVSGALMVEAIPRTGLFPVVADQTARRNVYELLLSRLSYTYFESSEHDMIVNRSCVRLLFVLCL